MWVLGLFVVSKTRLSGKCLSDENEVPYRKPSQMHDVLTHSEPQCLIISTFPGTSIIKIVKMWKERDLRIKYSLFHEFYSVKKGDYNFRLSSGPYSVRDLL